MRNPIHVLLGLLAALVIQTAPSFADTLVEQPAFAATTEIGTQTMSGTALGLDFDVVEAGGVDVTALGVFDLGGDGLLFDHPVAIFDRETGDAVASLVVPAGGGALELGFRYLELGQPLHLPEGFTGTIAAGYLDGNLDPNGNSHGYRELEPPVLWLGAPSMRLVGQARYGGDPYGYPATPDQWYGGGPPNRYHAGSFKYVPNPEPGTLALIGVAALGLAIRRRRRTR